jgi:choline-sulfatase
LPGASLFDLTRGAIPCRTIPSEYHAAGAFMFRKGLFKYIHYVGMPPQLFDLDADPRETRDLAQGAGYQSLVADCEAVLRRIVDPDAADALAKGDQATRIAAMGGREAIIARGSFGYSPTPGTRPVYN